MSELLVFNDFNKVDRRKFLGIYRESSAANSVKMFPDLNEADALREYENGYINYLRNDFFGEGKTLFILADGTDYVSALRLSEEAPQKYYLEALETNPDFRRQGYAKELLLQLQQYLKEKDGGYILTSHVEKSNAASLKTHFATGFEITADYVTEDGERYDSDYELTYRQR